MDYNPETDLRVFDPKIIESIKRHRNSQKCSMIGLISAVREKNIVAAIDFLIELQVHSSLLFGEVFNQTRDCDPYADYADIITKEFEEQNEICRKYVHDFLAKSGLKIKDPEFATEEECRQYVERHKMPDEALKDEEKKIWETFEAWKKANYIKKKSPDWE